MKYLYITIFGYAFFALLLLLTMGSTKKTIVNDRCEHTLDVLEKEHERQRNVFMGCNENVGAFIELQDYGCNVTGDNIESVIVNPYNPELWEVYCQK